MLPVKVDAIVLKRSNYLESDKIIKILTSEGKKIDLIAKGVRKHKSKLAGSIEPFGQFEACYVSSQKKGLGVLTSARLNKWYKNILLDQDKLFLGFEILRITEKNIEENADPEFFKLLNNFLNIIDQQNIDLIRLKNWYLANFLRLNGVIPNLKEDIHGHNLRSSIKYRLDLAKMAMDLEGELDQNDIKYLRIIFDKLHSSTVFRITNDHLIDIKLEKVVNSIFKNYLQI